MTFEYNLHGVLGIRSNFDLGNYFLGINYFREHTASPDLTIVLANEFRPNLNKAYRVGEAYYGSDHADWVYYEQARHGILTLRILLRYVMTDSKSTELWANKTYRLSFFLWLRLIGIAWNLIRLKLLQRDHALVHAACLSHLDTGVLLPAYGNTGKTLTTLMATRNPDWKYLSDDMALVDSRSHAYSFPTQQNLASLRNAGIRVDASPSKRFRVLFNRILRSVPMLSFHVFPDLVLYDPREIFQTRIKTSTDLKLVVFLQRGPDGWHQIDHSTALSKLLAINSAEFGGSPEILWTYSYFNPSLNLSSAARLETKIMSDMLERTDCYVLTARSASTFPHLLSELVKKTA
jgi:hypothetical protein